MFGELVMGGVAATGCLTGLAVARGRLFLDNRRFFADRRAAYEQWQAETAVLAAAKCVVEDEAHRALRDI
jgi:hypothetical protein